jgi:hypothetical protein
MYGNNDPIDLLDPTGLSSRPWSPWNTVNEPWFQSLANTGQSIGGFYKDLFTGNFNNMSNRYAQGPLGQAERLTNPCGDFLDRHAFDLTASSLATAAVAAVVAGGEAGMDGLESLIQSAEPEMAETPMDTDPSSPIGRRGNPMDVAQGTNSPTTINGVDYSGHALDQMQGRGVMPSVVEDTINYGEASPGNRPGTTVYSSGENRVSVVVNSSGRVITVITK